MLFWLFLSFGSVTTLHSLVHQKMPWDKEIPFLIKQGKFSVAVLRQLDSPQKCQSLPFHSYRDTTVGWIMHMPQYLLKYTSLQEQKSSNLCTDNWKCPHWYFQAIFHERGCVWHCVQKGFSSWNNLPYWAPVVMGYKTSLDLMLKASVKWQLSSFLLRSLCEIFLKISLRTSVISSNTF